MRFCSKLGPALVLIMVVWSSCGHREGRTTSVSGRLILRLHTSFQALGCEGLTVRDAIPSLNAVLVEVRAGFEEKAGTCLDASPEVVYREAPVPRSIQWIPESVFPLRPGQQGSFSASPDAAFLGPEAVPPAGFQVNDPLYCCAPYNDSAMPGLPAQWGLYDIGSGTAWQNSLSMGGSVTVAVIDSGLDLTHPEFDPALVPGKVVGTYNAATSTMTTTDTDVTDMIGHGTHVAGIIGAATNNGIGVASIGAGVHILAIKVMDDLVGSTDSFTLAKAVSYAADAGARVINLSLGGPDRSRVEMNALSYAVLKGAVVAISAGNSALAGNIIGYPGAYAPEITGLLCVGALAPAAGGTPEQVAAFSTHNFSLTIAAPGVEILSTVPRALGDYAYASGTSMAAPFVAGAAAFILDRYPTLTPENVVNHLRTTARTGFPLPSGAKDPFAYYYGSGGLDAGAAMQKAP